MSEQALQNPIQKIPIHTRMFIRGLLLNGKSMTQSAMWRLYKAKIGGKLHLNSFMRYCRYLKNIKLIILDKEIPSKDYPLFTEKYYKLNPKFTNARIWHD